MGNAELITSVKETIEIPDLENLLKICAARHQGIGEGVAGNSLINISVNGDANELPNMPIDKLFSIYYARLATDNRERVSARVVIGQPVLKQGEVLGQFCIGGVGCEFISVYDCCEDARRYLICDAPNKWPMYVIATCQTVTYRHLIQTLNNVIDSEKNAGERTKGFKLLINVPHIELFMGSVNGNMMLNASVTKKENSVLLRRLETNKKLLALVSYLPDRGIVCNTYNNDIIKEFLGTISDLNMKVLVMLASQLNTPVAK